MIADIISTFDKRGKGFAVVEGIKNSNKEFAVWIDDDGQYDNKEIPLFVDKNYDLVCGYRDWDTVPFKHRLANKLINFIFNTRFRSHFKDISCGFVGFNRKFMNTFLKEYSGGGYEVDYKIKLIALEHQMKIKQVPVTVTYNEKSDNIRGIIMVFYIIKRILKE